MSTETLTTKKVSKFTPSKYQKDIFKFILEDNKNGLISAVAGSGKTTTLIKALEIIPEGKSVLFMAFNKSISDEISKRVPKNKFIDVKTVHSYGNSLLSSYIETEIEPDKYRLVYKNVINFLSGKDLDSIKKYNFDQEHISYIEFIRNFTNGKDLYDTNFRNNVNKLVNLSRLHFIDFDTFSIGVSELKMIAKQNSIESNDYECEVSWYISKLGMYDNKIIDYTDMVFLPNLFKFDVPKYDFVFIDECQDLNTCQRLLMLQAVKPETGRFIAVGDPKQSIYAFAGADSESYKKLRQLPNTKELPLSVTYRCGKEIINQVKHINPLIKPYTKNGVGEVLESFSYLDIEDGDMVLCRNTFPIVSLCINLLCKGRKAYIIGSDIGLSLKNMIKNCEKRTEKFSMENVISRLNHEVEKMIEKIKVKNGISSREASEETTIMLFREKIQIIQALSEDIEDPLVVMEKIDKIFSDNSQQGVCLSNIHKSKGLESNRVFILHRELMPSRRATLPWEIEQENNLIYVAYTRAKKTLGFITDYDAFASTKQRNIKKFNESKHVGSINSKLPLELSILDIRKINTTYGETVIIDMLDNNGNRLFKFGEIAGHFFKNKDEINKIGSTVSFYAIIKEHSTFKGENVTRISNLSIH
jgi:DNA helicase-2/ATP-dependent DNA helicase PcrA